MDADNYSMSSARPSSNMNGGSNTQNPMAKKRGFRRLSWRRLFYAGGPLMQVRPRGLGKGGRSGSESGGAQSETSLRDGHHNGGVGPTRKGSIRFATSSGGPTECRDPRGPTVKPSDEGDCYECPLCLNIQTVDHFPEMLTCPHRSCQDCLRQYLKIEIAESRINICCPECTEPLHPTDIRHILNDELFMAKYEEFMLRRVLATEPDARWCPAPDCGFAVIASGCASCPKIKCERPGCQTFFCYHCKQEWHPNQTCDAARAQRYPNVHSSSVSFSQDSAQRDDIKPCPSCQVLIVKMDDGSCNHMTCAVCDAEFCWLCMKEISDLHYLSPSGCTFWGKKPWSRKKKILWQLGTLVGAPVGISLVAGIAVPAIIIGIPVWVGRKLHTRYETASKHKRNLAITGGVTASILISPVLAGLAVGIGVPILLAYVYGVVPISLCRSGGCGVTTSASGVRIDFDENEMAGAAGGQTTVDAQSVDTGSHQVANPSIGEMSFGMSASLSMGSGSHLDRIGLVRDSDRESASNTAIAGASLTGSVSSSMVGGPAGHRLEVHADVASDKRFSFSSETTSATVSLSDRSATMSFVDDASTRALAGSIIGCRDTLPVEVHVDMASVVTDPAIEIAVDSLTVECDMASVAAVPCPTTSANEETTSTRHWRNQRGKQKLTAIEKQVNLEAEDTISVSERVRFDENVSFIDDFLSEEAQGALPPLSSDQWRPARRVGSASGCREEGWRPSGQTETWERAQSWQGVCEEGGMVWDRRAREVPVLAAWNKLVSENGETAESVASSSMSSSDSGSSASATTMENVTPLHRVITLEDAEGDVGTNAERTSALRRLVSAECPVASDSVTISCLSGETDDSAELVDEDELTVVCHRCSVNSQSES